MFVCLFVCLRYVFIIVLLVVEPHRTQQQQVSLFVLLCLFAVCLFVSFFMLCLFFVFVLLVLFCFVFFDLFSVTCSCCAVYSRR